jgi:hypothetical protein
MASMQITKFSGMQLLLVKLTVKLSRYRPGQALAVPGG